VAAMAAVETNDAEANTTAAISDFFISYLAKKQPRPAAWFFKNRGTSSYQNISKAHEKRGICALLRRNVLLFNNFFEDSSFTRSS
jgi:hypothetical protein